MKTKVMCIDDDRPILNAFKLFKWEDYFCHWVGEASNGQEALKKLPSLKPDLLLVDIVMPIMDGLAFIKEGQKILPHASFVIISAHCDFEYARQALRYNVTDYLTKGEYSDEDLGRLLLRFSPKEAATKYRYEIQQTLRIMEEKLPCDLTLEAVAVQVALSPNYLGNLFYQQTGMRFRDKLNQMRMERAKELILHTPLKIYEIAHQVGIESPQYFTSVFQKTFGLTPGQMRR